MARNKKSLRALPAVEKILQSIAPTSLPRPVLVHLVRQHLSQLRQEKNIPPPADIQSAIQARVQDAERDRIQTVLNGTGVIIHTNLGRSALAPSVVQKIEEAGLYYNNLELDLKTGDRGSRGGYLEQNLALACQAEAATVVNNCAAALVLILRHFTGGPRKEVIISRGELVQIGGGFRVPEILEASGAVLREVGTTNRTTAADYAKAVSKNTGLILKVHRSNFFMGGFVESAATNALADLARRKKIPLVEDLGSGALIDTEDFAGLEHEPTPSEILKQGVDLVCFSGDKLMGGPQAGLIAGKSRWIRALKKDAFFRALRCDKLILAALQESIDLYLHHQSDKIPTVQMLGLTLDSLQTRGQKLLEQLRDLPAAFSLVQSTGQVGGGTLPKAEVPSIALEIRPQAGSLSELNARLRGHTPAVIGYVSAGRYRIDLRTIFPLQDVLLIEALRRILRS